MGRLKESNSVFGNGIRSQGSKQFALSIFMKCVSDILMACVNMLNESPVDELISGPSCVIIVST